MNTLHFQQIVLNLTDPLYRYARWQLGQRDEAEDMVQETFLRLWKMQTKLKRHENIEALAFTVLRNLCIDKNRKKKIRWSPLDASPEKANDLPSPQRRMELKEEVQQLEQAAQLLPEQQRTILFMRNIEGYEIKEIAHMLGLKVNTVEVNLSRARRSLSQTLNRPKPWKKQKK